MQWKNELSYKFWLDVPIWGSNDFLLLEDTILISTENLLDERAKYLLEMDWDLCIVDETHRLLKDEERYSNILELSKKTENILLLGNSNTTKTIRIFIFVKIIKSRCL